MSHLLLIAALVLACAFLAIMALGMVTTMAAGRRKPPVCELCDGIDRTAACECPQGCGSALCWRYM